MYIKKLELQNFQVIEKFQAEFEGNIYFITGENELGKSTLLKAIGALLTGERDAVLRNGAEKGFAKMIVGDDGEEFDVSLSFTEANPRGTLTIKQKSSGLQTNNVSMLQRIFGYQDFDAVEFSRWSETAEGRRKQIAVVKSLLPENVRERIEAIDTEVSDLKAERTGVNRDVKTFDTLIAQIAGRMEPGDTEKYSKPMDITALMEQHQKSAELAERAKMVRARLAERTAQIAGIPERMKKIDAEFTETKQFIDEKMHETKAAFERAKAAYEKATEDAKIEREKADKEHSERIAALSVEKADLEQRKANAEKWLSEYEVSTAKMSDVSGQLAAAEAHNKKYSLVLQYVEKKNQFDVAKAKAEEMDEKIAELGKERADLIKNAALPIDGLTFTDEGLELNGVPFMPGKVSDSQTMEVAAKLVIASNPKVKVFRIARGESLGVKRLQAIVDIARKNGYQGFIEQVHRGQDELLIEEYTES